MDQNKLNKLKEIGYQVKNTCGTCINFRQYTDEHFGECEKHTYVHLKHSGKPRLLSVVEYGSCPSYESADISHLHGFQSLVENG